IYPPYYYQNYYIHIVAMRLNLNKKLIVPFLYKISFPSNPLKIKPDLSILIFIFKKPYKYKKIP
ncbi:TPA: hypothetical protein ACGE0A_003559, partial [Acinetobacter baumannii]